MNATTVLRLPWFDILLVRPRRSARPRATHRQKPYVRIAGLR